MPQGNSRRMLLATLAARNGDGNGSVILVPDGYTRARFLLDVTAASGTTPTLNVYVQNEIKPPVAADLIVDAPTGTAFYNDFISFTQATAPARWFASVVETSNFAAVAQDAALTAGTVRSGPLGSNWRVKWDLGGTSPSFTFSVSVELWP